MSSTPLVIIASARGDSNTLKAVNSVFPQREDITLVDLLKKDVGHYDYENNNQNDDFLAIAEKMVATDTIIFATPVYWYMMSGRMKVFFDRFSDLVTIRKDLGRALEGKKCYVVASGSEPKIPREFEKPLQATCQYFKMEYKGAFYYSVTHKDTHINEQQNADACAFGKKILID